MLNVPHFSVFSKQTWRKNQSKNIWCPCSPKCWTWLFEMLCQQLFISRPIIFIGCSSLASVDRLIYSNSESHLYLLYQKAQRAPYSNATHSRAGMLESERASERCLAALRRHSGTCTKECSSGEIIFANIYDSRGMVAIISYRAC